MREQPEPTHAPTPPLPWWLATIVILGALLTAGGGILALVRPETLIGSGQRMNEAAYVYAGYLVSRNLALAIMLIVLLSLSAKRALSNLMLLVALIQLLDACIDCAEHRWPIVPGVIFLGLVFFLGAARLSNYPFWKSEFWTQ